MIRFISLPFTDSNQNHYLLSFPKCTKLHKSRLTGLGSRFQTNLEISRTQLALPNHLGIPKEWVFELASGHNQK